MKSEFEILISILSAKDKELVSHTGWDCQDSLLQAVEVSSLPEKPLLNVVYIINSSNLPDKPNNPYCNIFCTRDRNVPSDYLTSPSCNVIISSVINADQAKAAVSFMNTQRHRMAEFISQVMDELYKGKGIQAISDLGSILFENPVFIWDSSFKAIALPKSINIKNPLVLEDLNAGFVNPERMKELPIKDNYMEAAASGQISMINGPLSDYDIGHGWAHSPVKINGITAAYIIVYAENTPLYSFQKEWIRRLAQLTALELGKNRNYDSSEDNVYTELINDILEGRITDRLVILRRLEILEKQLKKYIYTVVLRKTGDERTLGSTASERKLLHGLFPKSISAPFKGDYIYFVSGNEDGSPLGPDRDEFERVLTANGVIAGVSNVFTDISDAKRYYMQAVKALEFSAKLTANPRLSFYSDYSIYHAIEFCTEHVDLRDLCHPGVLKLQERGENGDGELFQTLYLYLYYMKDVGKVTDALHIHRSTLFYRLGKIKEMLHVDFDNGDDMEKLLFSLKLVEYMDTFPLTDNKLSYKELRD